MAVDGVSQNASVSNYSYTTKTDSTSGTLTVDDFYTLLATQMKYQDADNPMDTAEMMNQLVQTQMIEAIVQMSQINSTQYGMSMVNQTVTVVEVDDFGVPILEYDDEGEATQKTTTGVVNGVLMGSVPSIFIGDKEYSLSQVMTVGTVPGISEVPEEEVVPEEELEDETVDGVDTDDTTNTTTGDNSGVSGDTTTGGSSTDTSTDNSTTGGEAAATGQTSGTGDNSSSENDDNVNAASGSDDVSDSTAQTAKALIFPDKEKTDEPDNSSEEDDKSLIFPEVEESSEANLIFPE